jgi:SAM-dependent methyltransferase
MTPAKPVINVPEALIASISESMSQFCAEIRKCDPRAAALDLANGYQDAFNFIEPFLARYAKPRILEIGSGYGFGLAFMVKAGLNVIGVEPGSGLSFEGRFETASSVLNANNISPTKSYLRQAGAEQLPFADDSFDIVFSIAVLEHVTDPRACLTEALRVVRPGGMVIMNVPNYNSFTEGHYDILWLPYLLSRKRIAKWYVRTIFQRRDYYVDELNFTSPGYVRKLLRDLPGTPELKIFYSCGAPFGSISAAYFHIALNLVTKNRLFEALRQTPVVNMAMRALSWLCSNLLGRVGWAPVFNVVCYKTSTL